MTDASEVSTEQSVSPFVWPPFLTALLAQASGLFLLAGGIIYTILGTGYTSFYGSFGIRPADVGFSPAAIAVHAGIALAVYGFTIAAVGASALLVLHWLAGKRGYGARLTIAIGLAIAGIGGPILLALTQSSVLREGRYRSAEIGEAVSVALLSISVGFWGPSRQRRSALILLSILAMSVLYSSLSAFSFERGRELADQVMAGNAIPAFGLTATFDFQIPDICLVLDSGSAPIRALWLGGDSGRAYVYRPDARETVSLDVSDLRFSIPSDDGLCTATSAFTNPKASPTN